LIVGIDEVGYGSLAGPVTVAACILDDSTPIAGVKDSKAFSSHRKRAHVASEIKDQAIAFSIAHRPNYVIDERGIVGALQQAQRECLEKLGMKTDRILIDGTPFKTTLGMGEEYIIKGDVTVACISAASILAKVARDELMIQFALTYPEFSAYGFDSNKGYGSAAHRETIAHGGLTPFHRKSYCAHLLR